MAPSTQMQQANDCVKATTVRSLSARGAVKESFYSCLVSLKDVKWVRVLCSVYLLCYGQGYPQRDKPRGA